MLLELTVAEQRFNAVMEVLRDGLTVVEVGDRYGIRRQAVHGWLRRWQAGGLEALTDRSHRPDSCPHQMPAALEARLCELRHHHPGWGQRRLAHELARDGVDPPPGLTSIYRALVRNGLIQPRPDGTPRPATGAGNGPGRWSCGSWTSWAVSGTRIVFVFYPTLNEENEVAALLMDPNVARAVALGDLTPFERAARRIRRAEEIAPAHPANQALRRLGTRQQPR